MPRSAALLALLAALSQLPAARALAEHHPAFDPVAHRAEIEAWRERRLASLRRDTGWLTLTGLDTLERGRSYALGSAAGSDVRLPDAAPRQLGTITVGHEGEVELRVAAGAKVTVDGLPVTTVALFGPHVESPPLVEAGSVNFLVIERGGVLFLRTRDRKHPALQSFTGLEQFPIDPRWRFEARFDPYDPVRQIPIANILGQVSDTPSWGAVVFDYQGETYRIDAVAEPGDEELFLIFGDATSGHETYGAGRYLYADAPDATGRVVVDFNRAYNPPCAFTPFATCPLPPSQNRLPFRVEAGEKTYPPAP